MTVQEMIQRKKERGYSNKYIAEISGVPLGTVQKIFSGSTETPRYETLKALREAFDREGGDRGDTDSLTENNFGVKSYNDSDVTSVGEDIVMEQVVYNASSVAPKISSNNQDDMNNKTLEDYLALPEGARIELIDGVFYDMAAPTFIHQRIGVMICNVFENFINENGGPCIPSVAPTDVQLDCDDKTMVQPDVLVVCDRKKIIKARVVGAPDLIVEVLSPSNWYMDIYRKQKKYKNAGVREYWIVLPDEKRVIVYDFEKSSDSVEYTFEDKIPVAIWDGKCEVDFKFIYDKISFLYD